MERIIIGLLLSLIAGLSTSIGSFIAFFMKKPSPKFISFIMGFSAGVMILISFVELLQDSIIEIGLFLGLMFFFLGMIVMFIIDIVVSHEYEFEDSIEMLINNNGECKPHLHRGHRHGQGHQGGRPPREIRSHHHPPRLRGDDHRGRPRRIRASQGPPPAQLPPGVPERAGRGGRRGPSSGTPPRSRRSSGGCR